MIQNIKNILWVLIGLNPILFWVQIYFVSITEYDRNWGHFFLAVIISLINVVLLFIIRNDNKEYLKIKTIIRKLSILLATPVTVILLIFYYQNIPMRWVSSSSYSTYSEEKSRNFFKAENILIIDRTSTKADTIKSVIKRNGDLIKLTQKRNGIEYEIELSETTYLTKKQKEKLLKY